MDHIKVLIFHFARIGDCKNLKMLGKFHKLDLNVVDDEQRTPMTYAAIGNNVSFMKYLLKNGGL